MAGRQPYIMIAFGQRGSGKTAETMEEIYRYVYQSPKRKALIFDVTNEFKSYRGKDFDEAKNNFIKIPTIALKDIPNFVKQSRPEVRRIAPFWDNGKRMTLGDMQMALGQILQHYKNGLLLVEDINKYTSHNLKMDLVGSLATIRQAGIDLIAHYQMIGRAANPTLVGMTNYFRVHRTSDNPYTPRIRQALEEKFEMVAIAYEMVKEKYVIHKLKTGKKLFNFLYTDNDSLKIIGKYTKEDAINGVSNFIEKQGNLIDELLRKRDRKGNKIYRNYAHAYSSYEKELLEKYF